MARKSEEWDAVAIAMPLLTGRFSRNIAVAIAVHWLGNATLISCGNGAWLLKTWKHEIT